MFLIKKETFAQMGIGCHKKLEGGPIHILKTFEVRSEGC